MPNKVYPYQRGFHVYLTEIAKFVKLVDILVGKNPDNTIIWDEELELFVCDIKFQSSEDVIRFHNIFVTFFSASAFLDL